MAKPTKIFYVTECKIHGKQSDKWEGQQVQINKIPTTKRERHQGCPLCKKEHQLGL